MRATHQLRNHSAIHYRVNIMFVNISYIRPMRFKARYTLPVRTGSVYRSVYRA